MIEMYLDGQTVTNIAKYMYRSPAFIKGNLDRIGVPTRISEGEKFIVPDECVKYEFEVGEWVFIYISIKYELFIPNWEEVNHES